MTFQSLLRILYPTAAALLCGALTRDAGATTYWHSVCGQAGAMKNPSADAPSWINSYCSVTQNSGSTMELDFPLVLDVGNANVNAFVHGYGSASSNNAPLSAQLITMNPDGSYSGLSSAKAVGSTPSNQTLTLAPVFVNPSGAAFVAVFAGSGSIVNAVHWEQ